MGKTFADVLASARRPEDSLDLFLRGDLVAQYHALERQLVDADRTAPSLGTRSPAALIGEQMNALRAQMEDSKVTFHLRALAPKEFSDFHASKPEHTDAAESDDDFRQRFFTWLAELVARCCTDPVMTAEEVAQLVDHLSSKQWDDLSSMAWTLNTGVVNVPFSVAAYVVTDSGEPK